MNRVTKFRAWIESANKMVDWEYLKDKSDLGSVISGGYSGYHSMQFTGLLDKNGKEIYEGDILKDVERDMVREVAWIKNSYGLVKREKYRNVWGAFISRLPFLEIIGNLYEHPNLLTT